MSRPFIPIEERFHDKYIPEPNSGCWLWMGAISNTGYGNLGKGGRGGGAIWAHRLSYEIHKGPIPEGKFVCHKCDVSSCVNPDHLFLGDNSENMRDCYKKKRHTRKNKPKGVIWIERRKKWRAYIVDKKFTHLGYFDTEEEAYEALVRANRE